MPSLYAVMSEEKDRQSERIKKLQEENKQLKAHNQYLLKLLEDNGVIVELMKGDME